MNNDEIDKELTKNNLLGWAAHCVHTHDWQGYRKTCLSALRLGLVIEFDENQKLSAKEIE